MRPLAFMIRQRRVYEQWNELASYVSRVSFDKMFPISRSGTHFCRILFLSEMWDCRCFEDGFKIRLRGEWCSFLRQSSRELCWNNLRDLNPRVSYARCADPFPVLIAHFDFLQQSPCVLKRNNICKSLRDYEIKTFRKEAKRLPEIEKFIARKKVNNFSMSRA